MKTLYEVLEVSETASNEIIEKAYKVLAKRYHPDLCPQDKKEYAENKMKEINDAYEVLSDETKRKEYDDSLKLARQKELEEKIKKQDENRYNQSVNSKDYNKYNAQKYQKSYKGYLKGLEYKIKYKWTWKNYRDLIITILIISMICLSLWFFPITHKWIMDFYESNPIVKTIIDIIGSIFVGIWNAICSFFKF